MTMNMAMFVLTALRMEKRRNRAKEAM